MCVALVALVGAGLAAGAATAGLVGGVLGGVLSPCSGQALAQPFLPWSDVSYYALAANGGFENHPAGWVLSGNAAVVAGNESYRVGSASDGSSLSLADGASALSSTACVGTLSPTMRFFVQNTGVATATLRVDVVYSDALGVRWSVPVATVTGGPVWQPTAPLLLLANVTALPLLTDGSARVAFRFTAQGTGGSWRIDDVYVDPYKGS
ncbi:MAG: hypothetical protein ABI927_03580 [Gaiellaceae bacterium]